MVEIPKVSIVEVHDKAQLYAYLERVLELIEIQMPEKSRIIIKPNLAGFEVYVSPHIVDVLIKLINDFFNPQSIAIVESNNWVRTADDAFHKLGFSTLAKKYSNIKLINLSRTRSIDVKVPIPFGVKSLRIPSIFLEYDYFITISKIRTMAIATISCALKNQFGCLPYGNKAKYHPYLDHVLANLNLLIRPDLCIVDGLIGFDQETPRRLNLLMASTDPVAVDSVVARTMGFSPKSISHIKLCEKVGCGSMQRVEIICDPEGLVKLDHAKKFYDLHPVSKRIEHFSLWLARRSRELEDNSLRLYKINRYIDSFIWNPSRPRKDIIRRILKNPSIVLENLRT